MKNQTFGIEIETTGIGRERTAKAIAAYFGTTAQYRGRHLDDWRVPMPDGRHWTVESDGSVTDPDAEVVSPVCRYEDIEMVQEVVRAIRAAGAKADGSCGIHIHIGLGEHTPQSLRRLVNIVNAKEDLLTMALSLSCTPTWMRKKWPAGQWKPHRRWWPTSTAMKSSTAIRSVTTTRLISMKSSPSSSSRTQSFEIKRAGSTDTP